MIIGGYGDDGSDGGDEGSLWSAVKYRRKKMKAEREVLKEVNGN